MLDVLKALSVIDMSVDLLTKTKVGQAVARVRKSSSDEVNTLAKQMIKKWRKAADAGAADSPRVERAPPSAAFVERENSFRQNACKLFQGGWLCD